MEVYKAGVLWVIHNKNVIKCSDMLICIRFSKWTEKGIYCILCFLLFVPVLDASVFWICVLGRAGFGKLNL